MIIRILRSPVFWTIVGIVGTIIMFAIIASIFYAFGFRVTYSPYIDYNWYAIGAVGQWATLIIAILIPIAAVYFEHRLQTSRHDISDANKGLLIELKEHKIQSEAEIKSLREMISALINLPPTLPAEPKMKPFEELKERALKFINMSITAKTSEVAKHLDAPKEDVWRALQELCQHDGLITRSGPISENDYDRTVWMKKKRT